MLTLVKAPTVDTSMLIGEGGEAEVFRIAGDSVFKLFKVPDPQYHQKLTQLPKFPPCVVAPTYLCGDDNGQIIGYTMPFVDHAYHLKSLSNRDFREKNGIDRRQVIDVFRQLHNALSELHTADIVVGDFNPLNVLIDSTSKPRLLDADSMQFGNCICRTFTPRYVDPLHCDPDASPLALTKLHGKNSDWYAFALMFFEALLFVHPYGGVHRMSADLRPLRRISVFNNEVIYPKAAEPLKSLPQLLLDFYNALLHKDARGPFPSELFVALQGFTVVVKIAQQQLPVNKPHVYHRDGVFYREDGRPIMTGAPDHELHFTTHGTATIVTKNGDSYKLDGKNIERLPIEMFRDQLPVVASNGKQLYWVAAGELWREDEQGRVHHIDNVIAKQTRIWAGPFFGVGLSTARGITRVFTFNQSKTPVDIPLLDGIVKDANCTFENDKANLFLTLEKQKMETTICLNINALGQIRAA